MNDLSDADYQAFLIILASNILHRWATRELARRKLAQAMREAGDALGSA